MAAVTEHGHARAEPEFIKTSFPVLLPEVPELRLPRAEFDAHIRSLVQANVSEVPLRTRHDPVETAASRSKADSPKATTRGATDETKSPFMDSLLQNKAVAPSLDKHDGKMLTENSDVAYRTSANILVDLFHELEDVISGERLKSLLDAAWREDAEATLALIWNARSIHLGKSSRPTFYRAVGWLAQEHPATLLVNLPWLVRPMIPKKTSKPNDDRQKVASDDEPNDAEMVDMKDVDSDFEFIENESPEQPSAKKAKLDDDAALAEFDVKFGVSHGYWKDLLNILALAVNDELKVDGNPRHVLNVNKPTAKKRDRDWTQGRKKDRIQERHDAAVTKLQTDSFYKALHLSVARLFADQLRLDTARLSGSRMDKKRITLAGKWAPTTKCMHDEHTCIVSSIAELLHPVDEICAKSGINPDDRTMYLKYAREAYQRLTLSPLRQAIDIVERPIADNRYCDIKYDRIPSLAMRQYTGLFIKKDQERFEQYIEKVASGKARISGATLLPSTLVKAARGDDRYSIGMSRGKGGVGGMIEAKTAQLERDLAAKTADGQWKSLCQRIKDSGKLQSSIAVCDVSGSMTSPSFPDGTVPMDSAVGLSLLLAEVVEPPFGGAFITFSAKPQVMRVGGKSDKRSLKEKIDYIERSNWSMHTDVVAVFEKLLLPMAIKDKIKAEDMVKQVFVFSDMQFDMADSRGDDGWTTSFERIEKKYKEAGYTMPKLIFWNLAGGRAGYPGGGHGDETAPKPVTAAEENTALVSGYSQGQLKMFLENGQFDDPEDEEVVEEVEQEGEGADDEVVIEKKVKKAKMDPTAVMRKAISHEAYRMLKVVD